MIGRPPKQELFDLVEEVQRIHKIFTDCGRDDVTTETIYQVIRCYLERPTRN